MPNIIFQSCLLIEDDPAHALLVRRALKESCAEITHVESFEAARKSLGSRRPEIIVTDLNLPDSSRTDNVSRLKAECPECPIVVLTSSTSIEDAVQAMKLGARDFIVKNFDNNFREILQLSLARIYAVLTMEEERRRLEHEMEALRLAIENSNDGLAVADNNGKVIWANSSYSSFARLVDGSDRDLRQLVGKRVEQYELLQKTIDQKLDTLTPGAVWHTELRLANDKDSAYDLSFSVINAKNGLVNERVIWLRNISEEKRREKFQREILSATTHDLKGPLGTILLSTEVAESVMADNRKVGEILKRIASLAQGATNMIEEFLSARRIKEGTLILKPLKNEIVALAKEALAGIEPMASVRQQRLQLDASPDELYWPLDRLGLLRVLANLLSNAIKFTPKGGSITLKVFLADSALHLSVIDTGTGMEPAEVNRIFERFARLSKHADIPGSGLGLFVVKSIVTAHGGRVEVTSQPGKGTTFDVILPADPPVNERGELISLETV